MKAYLQGPNGEESELTVTEPDPADGSFVIPFESLGIVPPGWPTKRVQESWIRIVPDEDLILPGETVVLCLEDLG